jgi:hypothetical protein
MEAAIFSERRSTIYESTWCRPRILKYPKNTNGGLLEIETSRPIKCGELLKIAEKFLEKNSASLSSLVEDFLMKD